MRVITGSARGRRLNAPKGLDTRPTSDRVKEAMFSIIQFEVQEAEVLDLFAGSGQLGIEALSRGARRAVMVDQSGEAMSTIADNLDHTQLRDRARMVQADCSSFLRNDPCEYDVAFLDPPYGQDKLSAVIELVAKRMRPGGIILCECRRGETLPETAGILTSRRDYRYGKTQVTTYRGGREEE